jgi:tetratricopeptide (TPR) repeat protein
MRWLLPHPCWLIWVCLAACAAQSQSTPAAKERSQNTSFDEALQLAKAHRYKEAAAAIHGVPEPSDVQQRLTFLRVRASIESGLGNSRAAANDMEAAAKLAPQNAQLRAAAALARLEAQLDAHQDPAPSLKVLRTMEPPPGGELEVRLRTAEVLSGAHLYAESVADYSVAAKLAPDRADIFFNLALAHYYNGEWDAALENAKRAKALEDTGSTESLLGDIHEKRGDALDAVHSYQAAVSLEPNVEQHRLTLAAELLRHQTFDAAIVVLEQAANLFPESVHVRVLLGLAYYLVDRSADAVHTLLEATRLNDDNGLAVRYLSEITLLDTAAPDPLAVAKICAFANAHPASKTGNAFCGGVMLHAAQETGDDAHREEILRRLREATQVAPKESAARCQLGKALEWTQQWGEARTQLEACVQLTPESPEGHFHLARVYRRMGLNSLATQQTKLQEETAKAESAESVRRANTVSRFLVLFDRAKAF